MREHRYWVYILVSSSLSAMYIGVTNDLGRRVAAHRAGKGIEFVKKYKVTKLVSAEEFEQIEEAIAREKQRKGWRRIRKNELVRAANPAWADLMDHDPLSS
jgi:putative endonuclease